MRKKITRYDRAELYSIPQLKERGWTNGLIKQFLLEPDDERENVYYISGPAMKLYLISRIEEIERNSEFMSAQEKAARRSNKMKAVAEKKAEDLIQQIEEMPITVRVVNEEQLIKDAYEYLIERKRLTRWNDDFDPSFLDDQTQKEFTERITFNYIRHQLTNYDHALEHQTGKIGAEMARRLIRDRICQKIIEAYPQYAEASHRYLERK